MPRPMLIYALLALACGVVFANSLDNAFHFDDIYRIRDNPGIAEFWPPWRHFLDPGTSSGLPRLVQFRPLLPLSLSINYAIADDSLVGLHLGNLLLQWFASILVYQLGRQLLDARQPWIPALVALVFAVHPVSGITVNYLSCRDLLLMQVCLLATLVSHVRMRRLGETRGRWALCLGLFALALLAKKNALVMPGLILLLECLPGGMALRRRQAIGKALPYLAVAGAVLFYTRVVLGFSDLQNILAGPGLLDYGYSQLQHHLCHYLRNFIWPFEIRLGAVDAIGSWQPLLGAALLLGSWVLAWRYWHTRPLLVYCLLSYQLLLVLTSSILPLHTAIVPYRVYPSSVFLYLGIGIWLARWPRLGPALLGLLAVCSASASVLINPLWHSEESLWRHSVKLGGDLNAHVNLAAALPDGEEKAALLHQAIAMNPRSVGAHLALGALLGDTGRLRESYREFATAVRLQPEVAQSRFYLARAADLLGRPGEAADQAAKAATLDPRNLDYGYFTGVFLVDAKRYRQARPYLKTVMDRRPDYRRVVFQLALVQQQLGELEASIRLYLVHLQQHDNDAQAWFNLGFAYQDDEQWHSAIDAFGQCLRHNTGFREAHRKLADCFDKLGDTDSARHHRAQYRRRQ